MEKKRDVLDSLAAGALWQNRLLELFWVLDKLLKEGVIVPTELFEAYENAERARGKL